MLGNDIHGIAIDCFGTAALINLESGHSLGWGEGGHGETPGGGGGGITD